jgi:hypothetical protein
MGHEEGCRRLVQDPPCPKIRRRECVRSAAAASIRLNRCPQESIAWPSGLRRVTLRRPCRQRLRRASATAGSELHLAVDGGGKR